MRAGPTDQQSRCSCGHRRGCRSHMPRVMRGGICSQAALPSRTSSAKRTRGCACQRCRPAWAKGHATTARRDLNRLPPQHRRLAERGHDCVRDLGELGCPPSVDPARAERSSFHPPSGRFPVAPRCAVHLAASGVPAGHQEIGQCPTKCSSMRPIRRKPGWLFCAATVSKNSTSSLRAVNNFAAISI
jgi:hypothetical protein